MSRMESAWLLPVLGACGIIRKADVLHLSELLRDGGRIFVCDVLRPALGLDDTNCAKIVYVLHRFATALPPKARRCSGGDYLAEYFD